MSLSDLTSLAITGGKIILITGIAGIALKQSQKIFESQQPRKGRKPKQVNLFKPIDIYRTPKVRGKKVKLIKLPKLV